jgi:hypothetical protein
MMLRVLSLGAGVQSSTLLLMAARGELGDVPDAAIFADTGWEPAAVYEWLAFLEEQTRGIIPIHRVQRGDLRADLLASAAGGTARFPGIPLYTDGTGAAAEGKLARQCTYVYKVLPVQAKCGELAGLRPRQRRPKSPVVELWMGISLDEVIRMKPSREPWIRHRWPLIERAMTRRDCLRWFERAGFPKPPKSSCIGCPFSRDERWRGLTPVEFADAVEIDSAVRRLPVLNGAAYLHRSLRPLDEVDFSTAEERGQGNFFADAFAGECEGMCGV